ncbi:MULTISPECIES: STAS domain-containing protein [unclassified Brevundimonas]|uniref:STAS domain-containing protein n=1 Tax=unclassified Brevundimonas TaxID=2622653 RepID=UPI003F8F6793
MSVAIALSTVLDLRAAEPLKAQLLAARGQEVVLDGSAVERLGGLCLQVLLSAIQTWRADGQALTFINVSEAFASQWSAFGASASALATQGEPA